MRSSRRSSPSVLRLVPAVALLVLAACGPGASPGSSASPVASTGAAAPTVTAAWVRLPVGGSMTTAAYMTVTGGSQADAILSASSPAASMASIHETTTDASGMTGMHPVDRIEVGAGATVKLEPGGYHVMLEGLATTLAAGRTVEIDLVFEHAGKVVVQAEVRAG